MIALVVGPDAATAAAAVDELVRTHDPTGLNTIRLDGKDLDVDEAASAVGTPPFFGAARVVVIEDLMARCTRASRGSEPERSAPAKESLIRGFDVHRLFAAVAPGNVLILIDVSLDSVPAAIKRIAPPDAIVISGGPPRGNALLEWLEKTARDAGAILHPRAARLLVERKYPQTWVTQPSNPALDRPPDLHDLRTEVEKLALAAHPGPIEERHVRELIATTAEDRLFPFVEALVTSRPEQALPALEGLRLNGEEPGRVAAQVYQQLELAIVLAEANGREPVAIGKELGLSNPNRMIPVARAVRRARSSLRRLHERAIDVDRMTKRGNLRSPLDQLYHLVALLSLPERLPTDRR